jgi:glycosyltransferase involved in cell wall biosynthesis
MNLNTEPNVLQIVTGLGVGGAERVVVELASEMITNGYNVEVISLNDDVSILQQYPNVNFELSSLCMTKSVASFFSTLGYLNRYVKQKNITVIHAHMFHSLMFSLFVKLLNPRINIVFTSHSYSGFGRLRNFLIRLTKATRNTDIIFSDNQHIKLNAMKTAVIKNSVTVPIERQEIKNHNSQEKTKFLFLGRLEKPKNPVGMIHLFSKMKNSKGYLIIAGEGYLRCDVERAIADCALQDRVELLGVVNDVPSLLANVDCLVMPSLWEGLPMVILEAGARSLPVISTPVGSIPELLADDCGYTCDVSEFTDMLDFVALNSTHAKIRGENLYKKVKSVYSLSNMMQEHVEVYRSAQSVTK